MFHERAFHHDVYAKLLGLYTFFLAPCRESKLFFFIVVFGLLMQSCLERAS